ncbi:MAG: class IV adenylate cyclase [bacterium]
MIEVELKSVVDDLERRRAAVEAAGATHVFSGRLEDRRYDTGDRSLTARDQVLRVRVYRDAQGTRSELDWKGPTRREHGYKLREELETSVTDGDTLVAILDNIGYVVTIAIDREIVQYDLDGAMIRFERYPRMDTLVEVEGTPEQIERAISIIGLPRDGFTSERLLDFATRFETRTGTRAALSYAALASDAGFDLSNA